jgi:hypothetical protein
MRPESDLPEDWGFLAQASIWEGTLGKARQLRPRDNGKF